MECSQMYLFRVNQESRSHSTTLVWRRKVKYVKAQHIVMVEVDRTLLEAKVRQEIANDRCANGHNWHVLCTLTRRVEVRQKALHQAL